MLEFVADIAHVNYILITNLLHLLVFYS